MIAESKNLKSAAVDQYVFAVREFFHTRGWQNADRIYAEHVSEVARTMTSRFTLDGDRVTRLDKADEKE